MLRKLVRNRKANSTIRRAFFSVRLAIIYMRLHINISRKLIDDHDDESWKSRHIFIWECQVFRKFSSRFTFYPIMLTMLFVRSIRQSTKV